MKNLLCVVTIMAVGVLSTARAQVLDQSQEVVNAGISVNTLERTAQGFVQGTNLSYLASIWVWDLGGTTFPLDLTLDLHLGAAVDPTGLPIVHTEDFTITEAPADNWHKFSFSSPVVLTPESTYTFLLKGAAGNTGTTVLGLNVNPSYGGTELILSTKNGAGPWSAPGGFQYDLAFRTYSSAGPSIAFSQVALQNTFSMTFTAEADRNYALQGTPDPANSNSWENVETIVGNGSTMYLFDSTEDGAKSYRISGN